MKMAATRIDEQMEHVVLSYNERYGGETLAAAKFIPFGTTVATDRPLFLWKESEDEKQYMTNICSAFDNCSEEIQSEAQSCFAPSDLVSSVEEEIEEIAASFKSNKTRLAKIIAICRINSYGVRDCNVALFRIGAKASHSCSPNVAYHITEEQNLVFVAQRNIEKGEVICASYIPDSIRFQSAKNRDEYIMPRRLYKCACDRCNSPDLSRVLKCIQCKNGRAIRNPSTSTWKCNTCTSREFRDNEMMLSREEILEELVKKNQEALETRDVDLDGFVSSALAIVDEQHWVIGLTRQMQFEKSLYFALYMKSPDMIQFDKLQLYLDYLDKATIGTTIFLDQLVTWCMHLSTMKLSAQGNDILMKIATQIYKYWRAYFGKLDKQVILLGKAAGVCAECGEGHKTLKRCGRCKSIEYCSTDCQKNNWTHHKSHCGKE